MLFGCFEHVAECRNRRPYVSPDHGEVQIG